MGKQKDRSPEETADAPRNGAPFQWLLAPIQRAVNRRRVSEGEPLVESRGPTPEAPAPEDTPLPRSQLRRILVALDTSYHSLAALETAADLAAGLKAQLDGLFVEDISLVRMAGLSVVKEVLYPSGIPVNVSVTIVERQLRAQATQARQALLTACSERKVKGSFRVVRGEVTREIVSAAGDADLLILGKVSRPLTQSIRMGSTARAAVMEAPTPVLLVQKNMGIRSPVVVVFDDTPTGARALTMGLLLAYRAGGYLTVLYEGDSAHSVQQILRAQAGDLLRKHKLMVRYRRLPDTALANLMKEIKAEIAGTLIISENIVSPECIQSMFEELDCPVMLVRLLTDQRTSEEVRP